MVNMDSSPRSPRKFQETAIAMFRNMTPLLARARSLSFKKVLMPPVEENRSSQQTESIKWQQEMFHRVLNTMCLVQEGLVDPAELEALRQQIIQTVIVVHPNGEWADFTRNKLLFLQDLFESRCISEDDYHKAKQPILARLADQGASIDLQDFKFNTSELKDAAEARIASSRPPQTPPRAPAAHKSPLASGTSGSGKKKTPIKHVMDAVARLKSKKDLSDLDEKEGRAPRVPHALDFLRPPDCPTRDPPPTPAFQKGIPEAPLDSPLFKHTSTGSTRDLLPELCSDSTDLLPGLSNLSLDEPDSPPSVPSSPKASGTPKSSPLGKSKSFTPSKLSFISRGVLTPSKSSVSVGFGRSESTRLPLSASPKGKAERSLSRKLSGLLRGWQKPEQEVENDENGEEEEVVSRNKVSWKRLDLLGKKPEKDDDFGNHTTDKDRLLSAVEEYPAEKMSSGFIHGQGPDTRKLKKNVSVRQAPTNFFIDQVLGDKIKTELDRIRAEMSQTNPSNQVFT